jgi:hypothetical protein
MRSLIFGVLLAGSISLGGCAATVHTNMVAPDAATGTEVDGVPYRMPERLTVEVYRRTEDGYVLAGKQLQTLPDPTRIYVTNFSGQLLADASLKIEQRQDGTLSTVTLSGTSKVPDMATNVSAGLDAVQAAHVTVQAAQKAAADRAAADVTAVKTASAAASQTVYDALAAKDAVTILQLTLSDTQSKLMPSEIESLRSQIRLAKLKANTAAVLAGQAIPYPDSSDDAQGSE